MTKPTPPTGPEPPQHNPDYIRQISGLKDALQSLRRHAENSWDAYYGEELRKKELKAERARAKAERAIKNADRARKRRDGMDERIPMNRFRGGKDAPDDGKDTPFLQWSRHDQLLVVMNYAMVMGLLGLGVINVKTVIMATELPAFLSNPNLALLLGGLVPAASVSLKSGYHICKLDTHKHAYAWTIFGTSVATTLIWVVLFALSFEGATGEITPEMLLGETSSSHGWIDTWRNIVQIVGEIVIGASLFLVIERIQATYSGVYFIDNPNRVEADKAVASAEAAEAEAVTEEDDLLGEILRMRAAREVFIDEGLAMLHDFRSGKHRKT